MNAERVSLFRECAMESGDIRVLRGDPDPAELAALVAVLGVLGRTPGQPGAAAHQPGWLDTRPVYRSPGSWAMRR